MDKIVTPLLLAVGAKDSISGGASRYEDAVHFSEALRKAGRTAEFVVYPDAGHEVPAS